MSSPLEKHRLVPCAVMERLCFLFADPVVMAEVAPLEPEEIVCLHMSFTGPIRGELCMALPHALCIDVAANALGLGPGEPEAEEKAWDATGELLNVICGQILFAMKGPLPIFDLTPPQSAKGTSSDWIGLSEHCDTLAYMVDDHPLLLRMSIAPGDATVELS